MSSQLGAALCSASTSPPRTITSAVGSLRGLNERLDEAAARLSKLSDQIGGPRPCSAQGTGEDPEQSGVLNELHAAAETAHSRISTIEELISSIGRQLG